MKASLHDLIIVAGQTFAIYTFLILILRFVDRRQLGQLNIIDLLIVILLGSAVETAMVHANTSLPVGLLCAGMLLLSDRFYAAFFQRSKRLRHGVGGGPVLLVHNGHMVEEHLRRIGLTTEDVMEALRERETARLEDVRYAILETDGEITVIPKKGASLESSGKEQEDQIAGGDQVK